MRIVVAPDKFKGSLEATDVVEHLAAGIRSVEPSATVVAVPVADGGEGTLDAAVGAGFVACSTTVTGPAGNPVEAGFALLDRTAVVEMALASGLAALPVGQDGNPVQTARTAGVPVAAVCGRTTLDEQTLHRAGFVRTYARTDLEPGPRVSLREAVRLLERVGRRIGQELPVLLGNGETR